jgi:4-amino-4-deoxy-L-arabinose transferase-like glycosyltransferase
MLTEWIRRLDVGILVPLGIGAILRFARVGEFDNQYYTATVMSMLQSPANFLFASFDPAGIVMVDKPPLSFWIQAVPAAIFGVNKWAVTLPQTIFGVLGILFLYLTMRSVFGRGVALYSAVILAVIPASVVIDSRNEPDSILVFTLLVAAVCVIRAARTGSWRWLMAFAVVMGLAFNSKMLVAFVPLPAFLTYYTLCANGSLRRVLISGAAAVAAMLVVSFSWMMLVALTPVEHRPYVGSTPDNSIWTLAFKYNGIDRFTSFIGPRQRPVPMQLQQQPDVFPIGQNPQSMQGFFAAQGKTPAYSMNPIVQDAAHEGIFGLLVSPLGVQLGWLLPLGLIGFMVAIVPLIPEDVYRNPSRFRFLVKESPRVGFVVLWGGWFLTAVIVFGVASSTVTHPYYLVNVAVPIAAVLGISFGILWENFRKGFVGSWLLPVVIVIGIALQIAGAMGAGAELAVTGALILVCPAVLVMSVSLVRRLNETPLATISIGIGALSVLIIPMVVAATYGERTFDRQVQQARVDLVRGDNSEQQRFEIISDFIRKHTDADTMLPLVTVRAREAAPFIIDGIPAIAIGGFSGSDPVFSIESFLDMAQRENVRYLLMPSSSGQGVPRAESPQEPILSHVRRNWHDVSLRAKLPLGTLYRFPGY